MFPNTARSLRRLGVIFAQKLPTALQLSSLQLAAVLLFVRSPHSATPNCKADLFHPSVSTRLVVDVVVVAMGSQPLSVHRSEPVIFNDFRETQERQEHEKVLLQTKWRLYEERKAAWLGSWLAYEAKKVTSTEARWAEYEKVKDEVQRRWREYDQKCCKGSKIPLDLTIDNELTAPSRQWWKTDEYKRKEASTKGTTPWTGCAPCSQWLPSSPTKFLCYIFSYQVFPV